MHLHSPDIIFLSETKNKDIIVKLVQRQLNMPYATIVDHVGLSRGLSLFWNDKIQVCQSHTSQFYIETLVHDLSTDSKYWCIFVYLSTDRVIRRAQLTELTLKSANWGPLWIIVGDFNDIMDKSEKVGGRSREVASFKNFKIFLWNLGAIDLGFKGKPWTWWCFRENDGIIQERLDRVIVSPGWRLEFPLAQIIHLNTEASDKVLARTGRWLEQSKISSKLKKCRASLMSWLRRGKGNSKQRIIGIKNQIDKLKNDPDYFDLPKLRLLRKELGLQREKGKASIGMAVIDSCGHLLHAFGTPIQFGWSKVHILSDANNVIQILQKNLITSWEIETICEDVWRLMKSF
ncbi:hypothetical protein R3W88_024153 [Solanum pinnatisectum]|uniref:Endonuclease/exonuclease/phosphatase domain-containing protein n=1 Tax=Solanum pinnatisectum TaxID=50273 RepID=A0AAV9M2T0_9SOLN|nr:hypothetical protein R3W88_024153 [Solanum pinnatisectum]